MLKEQTVEDLIREQLRRAMDRTRRSRPYEDLPDEEFLFGGVERALGLYDSGQDRLRR